MYLRFLKYAVVEPKTDFLQRYSLIQEEIKRIIETNKIDIFTILITFIGYLFRFAAVCQILVYRTDYTADRADCEVKYPSDVK